jgi:hypothetical protein
LFEGLVLQKLLGDGKWPLTTVYWRSLRAYWVYPLGASKNELFQWWRGRAVEDRVGKWLLADDLSAFTVSGDGMEILGTYHGGGKVR